LDGLISGSLEHAEAEMDEFAHGGTQRRHLALPTAEQTLVLGLEVGIAPDAGDGGHVEGGA
jgi:hypothetical protein